MHGLPMNGSTAMPMSNSSITFSPAAAVGTSMQTVTHGPAPEIGLGAVNEVGDAAASASITALPMAGLLGGCDAEHDGCLATLRGQPRQASPATVTLLLAGADSVLTLRAASGSGPLGREPPPSSRPCLNELFISRT